MMPLATCAACLLLLICFNEISAADRPNKARPCRNEYTDMGFCVSSSQCESSRGVNIGLCSGDSDSGRPVCCMFLPCSSKPDNIGEVQNVLDRVNVRHTRDLKSIIGEVDNNTVEVVSVLSSTSEKCGFRSAEDFASGQSFFDREHQSRRDEQLINGVPATQAYPWMLALWIRFGTTQVPTCGAGLISTRYVISAGHCVADKRFTYFLRGGSLINKIVLKAPDSTSRPIPMHPGDEFGEGGKILEIESIQIHPNYEPFTFENDISLIRLKDKIIPSRDLFPICLPPPVPISGKITDYSGQKVLVTGWGCERESCGAAEIPTVLREAFIPIVPNEVGMCWFMNESSRGSGGSTEYIPSRIFMIAGDEMGSKATCNGDSGSPVVRRRSASLGSKQGTDNRYEVVGIVSWSKGCGRPSRPSVWTRVQSFVDWIIANMQD